MGCCNSNIKNSKNDSSISENGKKILRFNSQFNYPINTNKPLFKDSLSMEEFKKSFEFISQIGKGGFGKVKLFRNKSHHAKYAIKSIKKDFIRPNFINTIITEVSILKKVDHPHVVKIFNTYEDLTYINIVMEYIQGESLRKVIQNRKFNKFHSEKTVIEKIVQSVKLLHEQGIIHRDIKAENILFLHPRKYTDIKIIDFGLSYMMTDTEKKDYTKSHTLHNSIKMNEKLYGNFLSPNDDTMLRRGSDKVSDDNSKIKLRSVSDQKRNSTASLGKEVKHIAKKSEFEYSISNSNINSNFQQDGNQGNLMNNLKTKSKLFIENTDILDNRDSRFINMITPVRSNRRQSRQNSKSPRNKFGTCVENRRITYNKKDWQITVNHKSDDEEPNNDVLTIKSKTPVSVNSKENNRETNNQEKRNQKIGSPYYLSPEMIQESKFSTATDVWSLGVLMYYMLTGNLPFRGENLDEISENILGLNYDKEIFNYLKYGTELKDLLSRIFVKDESKRITTYDILSHVWFRRKSHSSPQDSKSSVTYVSPNLKKKISAPLQANFLYFVFQILKVDSSSEQATNIRNNLEKINDLILETGIEMNTQETKLLKRQISIITSKLEEANYKVNIVRFLNCRAIIKGPILLVPTLETRLASLNF